MYKHYIFTEPFDIILMDFEMPIMNGPLATKRLRELGCKAPIIGRNPMML
jgi:CheY-like chemotaxis protein